MPILIKKGSDRNKKAKKKNGEDARIAITDMTDILDFKVYRVTKPNFHDNTVAVKQIGEAFYNVEEEASTPAPTEAPSPTVGPRPPSMMEKLQKMQWEQGGPPVRARKDVFERVLEIQRRARFIQLGQSLEKHFTAPSIDDCLAWCLKHVLFHGEALLGEVLELDARIKAFEALQDK
jgi:hypothetical protein